MSNLLEEGIVITASRRYVTVYDSKGKSCFGKRPSSMEDLVAGDVVNFSRMGDEVLIEEIVPRRNCLKRCYKAKEKLLAANLDSLFVVTSPGALFNTVFIDRIMTTAAVEKIPVQLIVNKIDLTDELTEIEPLLAYYESLKINIIRVSIKKEIGLNQIKKFLETDSLKTIAFAGVSGVGKSSLLNWLIPQRDAKIQEVSAKTGQGKQTTSQAIGYNYNMAGQDPLILIDLPGIQNFGVTHLTVEQVKLAFPEFLLADKCKFNNCIHINEPDCKIIENIASGKIAKSRYDSYTGMVEEINDYVPY